MIYSVRRRWATALFGLGTSLAIAAAGLGLVACASPAGPGTQLTVIPTTDRQPGPPLKADLLDGSGSYDLATHRGEVVVINFWASWCGPCVAEADDLESTYQATRKLGVSFIGVNVRDERDKARAFVRGRVTYPSVFDPASRAALSFSVTPTSIPATIVVDRQGRIAATAFGAVLASDLTPVVRSLAGPSAPASP